MSEVAKYDAQKKKLEGLCEEHDFTYRIRKDRYPITLTIRPVQGVEEQLTMLEQADGQDYISPNASLTWSFSDNEVTSKVEGGTFTMPKSLESKFLSIFKKLVSFWQQYFFKYLIEKGFVTKTNMPVIDENDADDDEDEPEEEESAEHEDNGGSEMEPEEQDASADELEDLVTAATQLVRMENKATVSLLQRRLNIGYSKAGRVMQALEDAGVVGPYRGSEPREVLPYDVPADTDRSASSASAQSPKRSRGFDGAGGEHQGQRHSAEPHGRSDLLCAGTDWQAISGRVPRR